MFICQRVKAAMATLDMRLNFKEDYMIINKTKNTTVINNNSWTSVVYRSCLKGDEGAFLYLSPNLEFTLERST